MTAIGDSSVTTIMLSPETDKLHFTTRRYSLRKLQAILFISCSVLNKLTLLKLEIHMEVLKKKYTPYTESERMSYIREYLSTSETKSQFAKRTGICRRLLILWLDKYHINDKVMSTDHVFYANILISYSV